MGCIHFFEHKRMNGKERIKRYMKPVRIIFAGIICGIVSNVYADIASVQYVQSVVQDVDPTVTGADVALIGYAKPGTASAVATTDNVNQAIGKLEKALDDKISANADITASGATNKIVQYDAKGLVVAGTTAGALATMDTVGSTEITDGSIVDADISSTAAISTSKINGLDTALADKVPTTTTVNSKALSSNITLDASDVGAVAATQVTTDGILTTNATTGAVEVSSSIASNKVGALTGYAKGSDSTALTTSDSLNQALGKVENQIDGKAPIDDVRFNTVSTTQPSGTPPTGSVFIWFN